MLKPMPVDKDFQTWHWLAGSTAASQSEAMLDVRKTLLTDMEFNMDFT